MMRQRPNNGNMHGGGKGWKAKSTTDFDIVVTDLEGNIVASTKDVEDIYTNLPKSFSSPSIPVTNTSEIHYAITDKPC